MHLFLYYKNVITGSLHSSLKLQKRCMFINVQYINIRTITGTQQQRLCWDPRVACLAQCASTEYSILSLWCMPPSVPQWLRLKWLLCPSVALLWDHTGVVLCAESCHFIPTLKSAQPTFKRLVIRMQLHWKPDFVHWSFQQWCFRWTEQTIKAARKLVARWK